MEHGDAVQSRPQVSKALTVAMVSFLPLGSILIPYLYQEVTALPVSGGTRARGGGRRSRHGHLRVQGQAQVHEAPWIAALAIGLALLPACAGSCHGALPCYLTGTACSESSQSQEDLSDRLEGLASADGSPSYFLGRSSAGLDLVYIEVEGEGATTITARAGTWARVVAATRYRCTPPGVPAGDCQGLLAPPRHPRRPGGTIGGGVVLFTHDSTVTIIDDKFDQSFNDRFEDGSSRDLRSVAEALRPVSGPAETTKPLPAPVNAPAGTCSTRSTPSAVPTQETTGGEPIDS